MSDIPSHDPRAAAAGAIGRRAALLSLAGLAATVVRAPRAQATETRYFKVGAGPIQSRYFQIGTAIAGTVSAPAGLHGCDRGRVCGVPGLIGIAISTNGPVENLRLVAARHVDAGLCQGGLIMMTLAKPGAAGTPGGSDAISVIAPLYQEFAHLVVLADSPIREVADLRGRRVSIGDDSSGCPYVAQQVLAAARLPERQVKIQKLAPGVAADRLVAREIDAFFCIEGAPSPIIQELASGTDIRLIPIDADGRLLPKLPYSAAATIPDESYRGIGPTRTVGMPALLACHSSLEPDLVYAIVQAMWRSQNRSLRDALASESPPNAFMPAATAGLPLHPGAERFYRDFGKPG